LRHRDHHVMYEKLSGEKWLFFFRIPDQLNTAERSGLLVDRGSRGGRAGRSVQLSKRNNLCFFASLK